MFFIPFFIGYSSCLLPFLLNGTFFMEIKSMIHHFYYELNRLINLFFQHHLPFNLLHSLTFSRKNVCMFDFIISQRATHFVKYSQQTK